MKFTAPLLAVLAFAVSARAFDSVIVINEIQYNALPGQSEWIELRNLNAVDVNTAGWTITGGVDYTFPATGPGSFIPGHGYLVIAANPVQVPGSIGPFAGGSLDNGGETIRVRNLNGRIMDEVNYDDEGAWPVGADGSGATLSRRLASAAGGAEAWATSTALGGTPGALNFPTGGPQQRSHVSSGTSWKYRDDLAAPPADWNAAAFDDTTWSSGNAALGAQAAVTTLSVTADLVERYRASDITGVANGGVVGTWTDTANGAAYGDSIAQNAIGANSPTYQTNVVNGKAVVRFPNTGMGEMRTSLSPGIASTSGWAVFLVAKANTTPVNGLTTDGAGDYLLDRSGATNQLASIKAVGGKFGLQKRTDANTGLGGPTSSTNISTSAFQIVAIRRNRTLNQFELWVDGVMEGTTTDDGTALTPTSILIAHHATAGSAQGFKGDIAEVLVYKAELSNLDFQKVGAYLETEYGLNTAFQAVATTLAAAAPTCYFRKSFNFPGEPSRTSLRLNHTVADGAVFYLNGTELLRPNMPGGAVTHSTPASSVLAAPVASGFVAVPAGALVNGTNVLAVSLHKGAGGTSSYFDAAFESTELPADPNTAGQLRFHEVSGASDAAFYVEFENTSGAALNTSGWSLTSSTGQSVALPAQVIPAGGLMTMDAAALGFTPADGTRLYLMAPGGSLLRDAREVTNRIRGLTTDGRWGHPTTATPGGTNVVNVTGDVVINEIFYHAANEGPEQWIELHNKGAAAVDISGWKFTDGISFDFPAATSIPAGGYLVVAWDPAAFAALHSGVTALGPWSGNLSRNGELITLRDANDNVADQLRYADGGRWSQWADGGGSSLELRDPHADNSRGEAWAASDESHQSTWQTVNYSGLGTNSNGVDPVTWHEFCFGLLDGGEWLMDDISVKNVTLGNVELVQNGTFAGGTAAFWRIIGNHAGTVQDDPLSPGNKVIKVAASGATEHMHNNAGTTLKNGASFHTISASQTYAISFRAKWLRGSNRLHTRLYCNRLPLQTLLNRPVTGGTPGAVNRSAVVNAGPTFDALTHSPAVPAASEPVVVTVSIADSDGMGTVELFTSLNGAAFSSTTMTTAGDGRYTATVPGQSAGAQVQFYIRATDLFGVASFFPATGPDSRAMIPWQDGKTLLLIPGTNGGGRPHNIRIVMPGADANEMYKLENVMSNGSRPCTVILDDREIYYSAGVRLKSSEHGRWNANRVGFNLQFAADELFLGVHPAMSVDRSGGLAGGQNEILIKTVSNAAGGVHAPEDDIMRVIAPVATGTGAAYSGAGLTGPAIMSKTRFDDAYLDGQWDNGSDGPIFKYERVYVLTQTINPVTRAVDPAIVPENPKIPQDTTGPPGVNVINLGANKEFYRWYWLIENARRQDDYQKIMDVTNAIGQAQGSTNFNNLTQQHLDVSSVLRAHVPAILYGVVDNYLTGGAQHNVLFYFPPGRKAVMFPWDLDFLSQGSASASLISGQDLGKWLALPVNRRLYYGHLLDVLNRSFNDTFMTRWATHYSTFGTDDMRTALTYLRSRALYARDAIYGTNVSTLNPTLAAAIPVVNFTRTSASSITTVNPFTTVTGDGWINIHEIRLDGSAEPLAVTWIDDNTWSLQLPVLAGTNTFTLRPYGTDGALATIPANSDPFVTVTVTGSGGIFPAGPGNLITSEIHFNPPGSGDATEFIELLNITAATLDMSRCHFDDNGQGIAYTFANGVTIPPGGRILVVRNAAAFAAAYPGAGPVAAGVFTGALDNSGEEIVLYSAAGLEIFSFSYSDGNNLTDGGGRSLVRVIGQTPSASDYTWRASMADGGNPGGTDVLPFTGNALDDPDGDGHSRIMEYAFGTSDTVWNPATDFLTPNGTNDPVAATPVLNADHALVELQTSDDLSTWTAAASSPWRRYWRWKVTLR
jgi:hypothetical protein